MQWNSPSGHVVHPQLCHSSCASGGMLKCRGLLHPQVAASKVLVQSLDGSEPAIAVSTALQLSGLDLTQGALLLHDGWHAEVLRVGTDGSTSLAAQFEVQGLPVNVQGSASAAAEDYPDRTNQGVQVGNGDGRVAMALHGDCIYRTADGRVEACTWAGELVTDMQYVSLRGQC